MTAYTDEDVARLIARINGTPILRKALAPEIAPFGDPDEYLVEKMAEAIMLATHPKWKWIEHETTGVCAQMRREARAALAVVRKEGQSR